MGTSKIGLHKNDKYDQIGHLIKAVMDMTESESTFIKEMKEIDLRWKKCRDRFEIYDELLDFIAWKNHNYKLTQKENIFILALTAFKQLKTFTASESSKKFPDAEETMLKIIANELGRLELYQLEKLEKYQRIKRIKQSEREEEAKKLKDEKEKIEATIIDKRFSRSLSENSQQLEAVIKLFKHYESKLPFKKYLKKIEIGSNRLTIIKVAIQIINFIKKFLLDAASTLFMLAAAAKDILIAIPIIANVVDGIPTVINLVRTWVKGKSLPKKIMAFIAFGLFTAGLALTAVTIVFASVSTTVLVGGIAATVLAIANLVNDMVPWFKLLHKINTQGAELNAALNRQEELKNSDDNLSNLKPHEKQILLIKFEEAWLKNPDRNQKDFFSIKNLIVQKEAVFDADILLNDPSLKTALKEFLLEENQNHITNLKKDIKTLQESELTKRHAIAISIIAIVGLILVCIPPTLVFGAAILALTAGAGLEIRFNIFSKIVQGFDRLFRKEEAPKVEQTSSEKKERHSHNTATILNYLSRHTTTTSINTKTELPLPTESPTVTATATFESPKDTNDSPAPRTPHTLIPSQR